jgi:Aldo/keto reductase family
MQLAGSYAFGPPPDRASTIGVLQAGVAAGVDHIDTAQYYGPGVVNDLIREALHPYSDGLAIVSKVAVRRDDDGAVLPFDDPDQLREDIENNGVLVAANHRDPVTPAHLPGGKPGSGPPPGRKLRQRTDMGELAWVRCQAEPKGHLP